MSTPSSPAATESTPSTVPPGLDPLHAAVGWLASRAPSTVVHVGPVDEGLLGAYAQWRPTRLLLVDGRPLAGPLAAARLDTWPGVTWRHAVLAAQAGPAEWHGHTLARLDGVLRADGLLKRYPGAVVTGSIPVQAITLAALLDDLKDPARSADTGRLLVLDVPGTEALLLQGLTPQALATFDFVLYRGVQFAGHRGGEGARAALDLLRGRGFALDREDTVSEPLWPVRLLSLCAAPREDAALKDELAGLREASARLAAENARLREASAHVDQLRAEAGRLAEQQTRQSQELAEARQSAAQALKLSLLRDGDLRELQARHVALTAERDALAASLTELGRRLDALRAGLSGEAAST